VSGALAYLFRERDTLVIMFLTGWVIFTGVALLWAFLISRERRGLAAFCAISAIAQFAAFALLIVLVGSRAKTRGRVAIVSVSSFANQDVERMSASHLLQFEFVRDGRLASPLTPLLGRQPV